MSDDRRPLAETPPGSPPQPAPRPVYVVDDDPAILAALKFNLEIEGFAVETFVNGDAILAGTEGQTRGCLVIDYILPDGDGLSLLETMRARGLALPAILITTAPSSAMRARAAAAGATVVEKPLFGNVLIEAVQNAFPG